MPNFKEMGWPQRIDSLIRFFLYTLIFWLPYSPAVVEHCIIISFVLLVIKRCVFVRSFGLPKTRINRPVLLFLIACIFSVVGSPFLEDSAYRFITKTFEWFVVFYLVVEVFNTKKQIYIFLTVFLVTSAATALDAIVQFYVTFKDIFYGRPIGPYSRSTAAFKSPNGLGAYLAMAVPVLFSLQFDLFKAAWKKLGVLIIFFLSVWALFLTNSRGAWIGSFIGICVCLFTLTGLKKNEIFGYLRWP